MSVPRHILIAGNPPGLDLLQCAGYVLDGAPEIDHPDAILADAPSAQDLAADGVPVVVVGDEKDEARALRSGRYFVPLDRLESLLPVMERALHDAELTRAAEKAREALRKSEERYQDLVESANDVVLAVDLQGAFTEFNRAGEQLSGYTRDELRRMTMRDVLTPESYERALRMIQQKLIDNRPTRYELELIKKDGAVVPLEVNTKLILHDGRPVGVTAIARDITERRQAEAELRAREGKQAAVADLGQSALETADLDALFADAIHCVAKNLGTEYGSILELSPDGTLLKSRAGIGWHPGVVGREAVGAGSQSQAGYALLSSEPVVCEDLAEERRFAVPKVLLDHGVVTGASVIIHGRDRPFGVLSAFSAEQRFFKQDDIHFLQSVANVLAAAVERKRLEDERARHNKELAVRVLQAQEEERKRIARELHDETAQTLSILLTNLDLLERQIPAEDPRIAAGLARVMSLAKRALDETRALSHDLRPAILDDAGLLAAIEWVAREYERSYGGSARVSAEIDPSVALSPEQEVAVLRIAQEALTNAGKHAGAMRVQVSLTVESERLVLAVKDDGRGFNPRGVSGPTREGRLGIYGMNERAALLGGTIRIKSRPGKGTEVRLELPVSSRSLVAVGEG
jgi:PAS domain S-box-containing protein